MSISFYFDKVFTLEDVEKNTSLNVIYENKNWFIGKNDSYVMAIYYYHTDGDINNFINDGYEIITDVNNKYAVKEDEKILLKNDNGLKNKIDNIVKFGNRSGLAEILNELVITFQLRFMTDDEFESFMHDEYDAEYLFKTTMNKYGYIIDDNNVIKIR